MRAVRAQRRLARLQAASGTAESENNTGNERAQRSRDARHRLAVKHASHRKASAARAYIVNDSASPPNQVRDGVVRMLFTYAPVSGAHTHVHAQRDTLGEARWGGSWDPRCHCCVLCTHAHSEILDGAGRGSSDEAHRPCKFHGNGCVPCVCDCVCDCVCVCARALEVRAVRARSSCT